MTNPFTTKAPDSTSGVNFNSNIIHDTKRKYNDLVNKYIRSFENNIRNGKFQHNIREDRFSCKLVIEKIDNDYIDKTFIIAMETRLIKIDSKINSVFVSAVERTNCFGCNKTKLIISYREK